ncbi:MAG: MotA/TolQ/ExbB proton channel family protein [Pseudomonadota bacterium]
MQDTPLSSPSADASLSAPACPASDVVCATALSACPADAAQAMCQQTVLACPSGDMACYEAALREAGGALNALPPADTPFYAGLVDLLTVGGPVIMILAVLSLLSLAIILAKLIQFTLLNVSARGFVQHAANRLKTGDAQGALELLSRRRGPVARVMEAAVRGKALDADEALTREEVTRVAQQQLEGLEAGLPYLSLIATISPLLGLLGTVLGMIEAFQQLEGAGDRVDPAILSGGIWEALLTTAAGLSVAIPAAAVFTWLQRTVDVVAERMEDAATRVFTVSLFVAAQPAAGHAASERAPDPVPAE